MKDKNIRILSTRPIDEMLVSKALKDNITIDIISLIKTENTINDVIEKEIRELASKSITAVFTSMNGAEAVIETLQKNKLQPEWNIYCMGAATQTLLNGYFIKATIAGTGKDATELAENIIKTKVDKVVFFCGNQRREELPQLLQKNNMSVKEIVVYETNEIRVKIENSYKGILFFSPSAVKSFFSANSIPADTVLFSIGDTTAAEIKKYSHNEIIVSEFPSKDKLVEIAESYFDKTNKPND